jgi:hypothetical protein|tara:strand:- start:188 stop:553 length:366 start_codon:yes stop_codon:yes gene_type:complete
MVKKIVIAGLFLGGGVLFIKKILPLINSNSKNKDLELKNIDDAWLEADENMRRVGRETAEAIKRKYGDQDLTDINTFLYAPNLNFDSLTIESLNKMFANFKWTPEQKANYEKALANSQKGN